MRKVPQDHVKTPKQTMSYSKIVLSGLSMMFFHVHVFIQNQKPDIFSSTPVLQQFDKKCSEKLF